MSVVPVSIGNEVVGVACSLELQDGSYLYLTAAHVLPRAALALNPPTIPDALRCGIHQVKFVWICRDSDLLLLGHDQRINNPALLAFTPEEFHSTTVKSLHRSLGTSSHVKVYSTLSLDIKIKDLSVQTRLPNFSDRQPEIESVTVLSFEPADKDHVRYLAAGASGSPLLDERGAVVGVYGGISSGRCYATSISHLAGANLRFKISPFDDVAKRLTRVKRFVLRRISRQRFLISLYSAILSLLLFLGAFVFAILETSYAAAFGLPLIVPAAVFLVLIFELNEERRACAQHAGEIVDFFYDEGADALRQRLKRSRCNALRRLVRAALPKRNHG